MAEQLNELKSFVNDELSLSGQWSPVSKSSGFLVLKAEKTKMLNVQGAKQEEVRKKLFSLLSRGNLNIALHSHTQPYVTLHSPTQPYIARNSHT